MLRRAAGEEILVELFDFFDGLFGAYLAAKLPQHPALLRAKVGERPALFNVVWSYVEQAPELIRGTDDGRRLDLALAAVSLDDGRVDLEQCQAALGRLYLAAIRGARPQAALRRGRRGVEPRYRRGRRVDAELLAGFDRSFYFEPGGTP